MRTAIYLCLAGVAMAQGGSSSAVSLAAPTIETNSLGLPTGVITGPTSVTHNPSSTNGTIILPTSASNGTATASVNDTGLGAGGSKPTGSGSATGSGSSDIPGAAAIMEPVVGLAIAGAMLAFLV
ncbi:MAG: hypothetical protein GOMPHAMPRED_006391 [Gomphillus americanus]|uniref:Uncharacterized protein n=1 Tax=Gomphillus americanus TaxID=1940652 RepID=A0A8H3IY08_9LECA|nr:MAG: hypothetical protein GOMPHAMPRED_006391 [Gomphillus americanus]